MADSDSQHQHVHLRNRPCFHSYGAHCAAEDARTDWLGHRGLHPRAGRLHQQSLRLSRREAQNVPVVQVSRPLCRRWSISHVHVWSGNFFRPLKSTFFIQSGSKFAYTGITTHFSCNFGTESSVKLWKFAKMNVDKNDLCKNYLILNNFLFIFIFAIIVCLVVAIISTLIKILRLNNTMKRAITICLRI